jgi:prevent-host-death family protein
MKQIRVSEDIVPIAQFKSEAPHWLRRVADTGHPVVITLNGKPAGVLMSPAEYDKLHERERLLNDVAAGLADIEAGRVLTTDEVRKQLVARRRAKKDE